VISLDTANDPAGAKGACSIDVGDVEVGATRNFRCELSYNCDDKNVSTLRANLRADTE